MTFKSTLLTKSGRLKKQFLPAIYFDSSVIIDYFLAEPYNQLNELKTFEELKDEDMIPGNRYFKIYNPQIEKEVWINIPPASLALRKIVLRNKNDKINQMKIVREKLIEKDSKINVVSSPLAILEFIQWYAEMSFREISFDTFGEYFVKGLYKKRIRDYLIKAINEYFQEKEMIKHKTNINLKTIFEYFIWSTRPIQYDTEHYYLLGISIVDIINFDLILKEIWQIPAFFAHLQLGIVDILHLLIAKQLGCEYFASFDDDFKKTEKFIKKLLGITILKSPQEILNKLKGKLKK